MASFAQCYVCWISFGHFHCYILFHCINVPYSFSHYVVNGYLGSFQFGSILNSAVVTILIRVLFVNICVFLLGISLGVEWLGQGFAYVIF